ncbi:MAG: hypothetical protein FRX48_09246 [Lasallia pustulata]|uniref:DUF7924 domain-containing protein n=1 Tax=Lasallia pustulata TaxID=136370 RepID=A0A5M8PDE4_9LECA|nr:MAG: hypothetical protein FRX48_09246 [Lasallia pustulata]
MTLAVRGVVELFRLVKCEGQLHQKTLAFSILHDNKVVRIFGHYPIIDRDKTTFYRHLIKKFDFTSEEGKDKWTAYRFTKNIYNIWMPDHHKLICSAIDKIPEDVNFGVSLGNSSTSIASADNKSEWPDLQEITASAPSSQDNVGFKKLRLPPKVMLQKENNQQKEQINRQVKWVYRLTEQNKELKDWLKQEREQSKQEFDRLKEAINLLKQQNSPIA